MSTMLNAPSEGWVGEKTMQYLMDATHFEIEQRQMKVMCPFLQRSMATVSMGTSISGGMIDGCAITCL